jgi:hypothetical protein
MHLVGVFMRDHRDDFLHTKLCLVHPGIVLTTPPHDHRQLAAGRQRAPNVAHRKSWQIKEHRAETREDVIVWTTKIIALRIGDKERSLCFVRLCCFARCEVDKIFCAVDTYGLTMRAHLCRNVSGRVAKTATHIQYARPRRIGLTPEQLVAVTRQAMA